MSMLLLMLMLLSQVKRKMTLERDSESDSDSDSDSEEEFDQWGYIISFIDPNNSHLGQEEAQMAYQWWCHRVLSSFTGQERFSLALSSPFILLNNSILPCNSFPST